MFQSSQIIHDSDMETVDTVWEMTDEEVVDAVLQIEHDWRRGWRVITRRQLRTKNDCARNILFRSDYLRAMKIIKDGSSYEEWVEEYFDGGVDIDKVLVFATVGRDLEVCVDDVMAFQQLYLEWKEKILSCLCCYDIRFLSRVWKSCQFL